MRRSLFTVILYSAANAGALKAMSETPNNAARELVTTRLVPRRIRFLPEHRDIHNLPRAVDAAACARGASNRRLHGRRPLGKGRFGPLRETAGRQTAAKS